MSGRGKRVRVDRPSDGPTRIIVTIPEEWAISPAAARWLAQALLAAADEAEEEGTP